MKANNTNLMKHVNRANGAQGRTEVNIIKSTSAENNIGVFTYDDKGNITKSGAVSASDNTTGLLTERTFTSDRNHVASVTDTGGRTAAYTWDLTKDQLTRATDAKGTQTDYNIAEGGRLLQCRASGGLQRRAEEFVMLRMTRASQQERWSVLECTIPSDDSVRSPWSWRTGQRHRSATPIRWIS